MTFTFSRVMSAATATYGVYAAVQPRHLGKAMTSNPLEQWSYDTLARTYAARDLAVSAFGLLGTSPATVTTAMSIRIVCDVADGVILALKAGDSPTRARVLGVTLGWAGLNTAALVADRRRA